MQSTLGVPIEGKTVHPPHQGHSFASTRWSLVAQAADPDAGVSGPAIEELLRCYYSPMRAYLVRRGMKTEDADDCLQDFVLGKFLNGFLDREWKDKQRFRAFLKHCLKHFLISRARHENRSANRPNQGADLEQSHLNAIAIDHDQAADALDADWARTVLELTLVRMQEELATSGRLVRWQVFVERFLRPTLTSAEAVSYDELVVGLGFENQRQVENVLINEKRRFGRLLASVVGEYAGGLDDAENELRDLKRIVSAANDLGIRIPGDSTDVSVIQQSMSIVLDQGLPELTAMRAAGAKEQLAALLYSRVGDLRGPVSGNEPWKTFTIAEVLSADSPPPDGLDRIRRFSKALIRQQPEDQTLKVHLLLYHACIAACRIRTSSTISSLSDSDILAAASGHLAEQWFEEPFVELFNDVRLKLK